MRDLLDALTPEYRALFERARRVAEADERVRAPWLSGSLARGGADAASDLDLLVAVRDDAQCEFARGWREWLPRITPNRDRAAVAVPARSFYSVTPSRERPVVVVETVSKLAASFFRARRVVFDRDGPDARIPPPPTPRASASRS